MHKGTFHDKQSLLEAMNSSGILKKKLKADETFVDYHHGPTLKMFKNIYPYAKDSIRIRNADVTLTLIEI